MSISHIQHITILNCVSSPQKPHKTSATILDVEVWDNSFHLFFIPSNAFLMLFHAFNI